MAKYHLFAHNKDNYVKVGDYVEAYKEPIGSIGTAFWRYWAHLHHSISEGLTSTQILNYVKGWSKSKVGKYYHDPIKEGVDYKKMFGRSVDVGKRGWDWKDKMGHNYYHPGIDINGHGGGNTDRGYKFSSPVSGKVVFSGRAGIGWGKVIIIEQIEEECTHCPIHCN